MKLTGKLSALYNAIRRMSWKAADDLTVDEWADAYRVLDGGLSAEAGQWRTDRTPYMREPMRAFTDPRTEEITVVSPSQVGKSELELNCIGYIIDQDPSTILYIHPTKEAAQEFSRLRLEPCIKATPILRDRLKDVKQVGRTASSTIMMKAFPGGMLNFVGSNSASGLSSKPVRYIVADELDRWSPSAGRDGDPWELAVKRQATFFNRKRISVSSPTIKGQSRIEALYYRGTQERWKTQCPHCEQFHEIRFDDIRFTAEPVKRGYRTEWNINLQGWRCPGCGEITDEQTAKKQPARWEASEPDNLLKNRARSFWLNGFVSPWCEWERIIQEFFEVKNDPERLKVWKNTTLGELWEQRSVDIDAEELMKRAEEYPADADLPGEPGKSGPLILTCGVDCQHAYMQYEVVGWARFGESWGIQSGYIQGTPDDEETWRQLDTVLQKTYRFANGRGLKIAMTFVDSGDGKYTNEIARNTARREHLRVFACKGDGRAGKPFINQPSRLPIAGNEREKYVLFSLGVNSGKSAIMSAVCVEEPGPNYMHLPKGEGRGYDMKWYLGLLSETEVVKGNVVHWEKIAGRTRNEALDCRNYARGAFKVMAVDFDVMARELAREPHEVIKKPKKKKEKRQGSSFSELF